MNSLIKTAAVMLTLSMSTLGLSASYKPAPEKPNNFFVPTYSCQSESSDQRIIVSTSWDARQYLLTWFALDHPEMVFNHTVYLSVYTNYTQHFKWHSNTSNEGMIEELSGSLAWKKDSESKAVLTIHSKGLLGPNETLDEILNCKSLVH